MIYYDDSNKKKEDLKEGEETMKENRISFKKEYTTLEAIAIETKMNRILKELKEMGVGPSAFKLSNEIEAVYTPEMYPNMEFKFRDSENEINDNLLKTSASIFITKWEEIKKEILVEKKAFEEKEMAVCYIEYTREDGIDTIVKAFKNGANVDISKYLELPDLTDEEKLAFVRNGYGYDLCLEENENYHLKDYIVYKFCGHSSISSNDQEKLEKWIKENPDKCILQKNRNRTNQDMEENKEENMELC